MLSQELEKYMDDDQPTTSGNQDDSSTKEPSGESTQPSNDKPEEPKSLQDYIS